MKKKANKRAQRDFKNIKKHVFAGNNYNIEWKKPAKETKAKGLCESPDTFDKTITINPYLEEKELLKTALDESIHGCLFALDNDFVDDMSESIGEFLWRMGFRIDIKKE